MLLARLATRQAKPDGQHWLRDEDVMAALSPLPVSVLPGVGWRTRAMLQQHGEETVQQIRDTNKTTLEVCS